MSNPLHDNLYEPDELHLTWQLAAVIVVLAAVMGAALWFGMAWLVTR
jgi:hypothetical protein